MSFVGKVQNQASTLECAIWCPTKNSESQMCLDHFVTFSSSYNMKLLTLEVIAKRFVPSLGKTAINLKNGNEIITVFANGDVTTDSGLFCNVQINEVGDSFVATSDSKQVDDKDKPIYQKGDVVKRQKQTVEFKSFAGYGQAAAFGQAASVFGLNLNVVMSA